MDEFTDARLDTELLGVGSGAGLDNELLGAGSGAELDNELLGAGSGAGLGNELLGAGSGGQWHSGSSGLLSLSAGSSKDPWESSPGILLRSANTSPICASEIVSLWSLSFSWWVDKIPSWVIPLETSMGIILMLERSSEISVDSSCEVLATTTCESCEVLDTSSWDTVLSPRDESEDLLDSCDNEVSSE